jgi:polyvinyl alcohol dehydrogenase (cytochrome)
MPTWRRLGVAAALLVLGAAGGLASQSALAQPGAAAPAGRGNGVMGAFGATAGDPALGETLYGQRCANCHDNPTGRTPPRAAIAANTRTMIAQALVEGVMRPMAVGLKPNEVASIATYLSGGRDSGLGAGALEAPACTGKPPPMNLAGPSWNGWGNGPAQDRFQPDPGLGADQIPRLKLKWAMAYAGSRNGQATVAGGRVFLTSSSGAVYSLDARTGCTWWRFDVPGGSRSSITIGRLPGRVSGRGRARYAAFLTGWSERTAYALDAETGALIWKTQADDQQEVQMTGSPVLHAGRLYVPVSSAEEAIATDDAYGCCRFRGAVVALDAASGRVLWRTFMAPDPMPTRRNAKGTQMYGPAGGAIWSAPTIDARRGVLYVATGDSYTDTPTDKTDAVVALDLATGAVRWAQQFTANDNYIIGCGPRISVANCPSRLGPDHDFGASPILRRAPGGRQLLLVGQKSGQIYALDPDVQGKVVWRRQLGGGGPLGGVEFGPAADADTLYVGVSDVFSAHPAPGLYALRIADGQDVWSAPSPKLACAWKGPYCSPAVSQAVTAMPGAVFAGGMDGRLRAYASRTGQVLWDFDTAAAPVTTVSGEPATGGVLDGAGPTVAGGMVYVTSGYQGRSGAPGLVLMAFSVDGR